MNSSPFRVKTRATRDAERKAQRKRIREAIKRTEDLKKVNK